MNQDKLDKAIKGILNAGPVRKYPIATAYKEEHESQVPNETGS